MQVHVFGGADEAARAVAMVIASEILKKPDAVLGLATGSTPVPVYRALIEMGRQGLIDFSRVRTFNLDEYVGLSPDHPQSYRRFMNEQLFDHININKANTRVPSGVAADLRAEAAAYDRAIEAAGGIDLQLLGIGVNGHIGFNEPASAFPHATHVVDIAPSTVQANARFFDNADEVPRRAVTLGIGGIMAARRVVLLAVGRGKAPVIQKTVAGDATPDVPASILRFHPNAQLFLDREAAGLL
ncbi:MAG: glucosamine-6-phosphate deaminase [Clostridiales bacterium]|nr:glucosamine-6-phosphate deaminase [Clostridiales bacterium]